MLSQFMYNLPPGASPFPCDNCIVDKSDTIGSTVIYPKNIEKIAKAREDRYNQRQLKAQQDKTLNESFLDHGKQHLVQQPMGTQGVRVPPYTGISMVPPVPLGNPMSSLMTGHLPLPSGTSPTKPSSPTPSPSNTPWMVQWGNLWNTEHAKQSATKLVCLRGFLDWAPSELLAKTIVVRFKEKEYAIGAKFILGAMSTTTASGAFQSMHTGNVVMYVPPPTPRPMTSTDNSAKRQRVEFPEVQVLAQQVKTHGEKFEGIQQQLKTHLEEIAHVSDNVHSLVGETNIHELKSGPQWHEIGRLDATANRILHGGNWKLEQGNVVFCIRPTEEGDGYTVLRCSVTRRDGQLAEMSVEEAVLDDIFDTTVDWCDADEDTMRKKAADFVAVLTAQKKESDDLRQEFINRLDAMET